MLLDNIKKALAYLGVDSEKELREKYDKEKARTEEETDNLKKPQYDLDTVLKKAQWAMQREKSEAVLEQIEPISVEMLLELAPHNGFSLLYMLTYAKVLLWTSFQDINNVRDKLQELINGGDIFFPNIFNESLSLFIDIMRKIQDEGIIQYNGAYSIGSSYFQDQISEAIEYFTEQKYFSEDDVNAMVFNRDLIFLFLAIDKYTVGHEVEDNKKESFAYLNFYIGRNICNKDNPVFSDAVPFLKKSLMVSSPYNQWDSFWNLGYYAFSTPSCKQLAYDTFYSWIHEKIVGEICPLLPEDYAFSNEIKQWKEDKDNSGFVALTYGFMASICEAIGSTYQTNSPPWERFLKLAEKYVDRAIQMQDISEKNSLELCLRTRASILFQQENTNSIPEIIDTLQEVCHQVRNKRDKEKILSHIIGIQLQLLVCNIQEAYRKEKIFDYPQWELQNKEAFDLITECNPKLTRKMDELFSSQSTNKLHLIKGLADNLSNLLRRREYNTHHYFTREESIEEINSVRETVGTIAYYTSIKNAQHLFDVLYRKDINYAPAVATNDEIENSEEYEQGLNCLTMMNAHYMNDPTEGLALANAVGRAQSGENILFYGDGKQFREDIYNHSFVFLKSFTDKADKLLMWNRYGSDRNLDAKDSNGCYVSQVLNVV